MSETKLVIFKHAKTDNKVLWVRLIYDATAGADPEDSYYTLSGSLPGATEVADYDTVSEILAQTGQTNILRIIDEGFAKAAKVRTAVTKNTDGIKEILYNKLLDLLNKL